eukprot:20095_1
MASIIVNKLSKNPTLESVGHATSGAMAGAFTVILLYPIDQIKARTVIQTQSRILTYQNVISDFRTFNWEGIKDIYRGLDFGLLQEIIKQFTFFGFRSLLATDWKQKYATPKQPNMPWTTAIFRGFIAAVITQTITTPIKVFHIRKQTAQSVHDSHFWNIFNKILDTDGPMGFWNGMSLNFILALNPAIVSTLYDIIRTYLVDIIGIESSLIDFFTGALSKAIVAMLSHPFVLIKNKLQAGDDGSIQENGIDEEKDLNENNREQSISSLSISRHIWNQSGYSGFYIGLKHKLLYASSKNALMYSSKEKFTAVTFWLMWYFINLLKRTRNMEKRAMQRN